MDPQVANQRLVREIDQDFQTDPCRQSWAAMAWQEASETDLLRLFRGQRSARRPHQEADQRSQRPQLARRL